MQLYEIILMVGGGFSLQGLLDLTKAAYTAMAVVR